MGLGRPLNNHGADAGRHQHYGDHVVEVTRGLCREADERQTIELLYADDVARCQGMVGGQGKDQGFGHQRPCLQLGARGQRPHQPHIQPLL